MHPVVRSLWWKLAIANVVVTLAGSLLAVMLLGPALDARAFRDMVMPDHLVSLIARERDLLEGRLHDPALAQGLLQAMRQHLVDVQGPHGMYGIAYSSQPRVSLAVYGEAGDAVARLEAPALELPARWLRSAERRERVSDAERLLVLPLEPAGMLVVRHFAAFSVWQNLRSTLDDTGSFLWFLALVVSLPGLALGLGLTHWIGRRLRDMARVSEAWAGGDFRPRMDDRNRDELGRHALAMNTMAARLEHHLRTEQQLATLEERQRLARELHDGVKQKVFAAGLEIHAAARWIDRDPARAGRELARAQDINTAIAADVAEMLVRLQPDDEVQPLAPTLAHALQPWSGQVALQFDAPAALAVPAATAHELSRIVAEAVSNAVRHGRARRVQVRLSVADAHARLEVVDDGRGFDPGRPAKGMGLGSMRRRAAGLPDGAFELSSSSGGTSVVLRFALAAEGA